MGTITISMSMSAAVSSTVDLPEGKNWSDVSEWYVKWDCLHVKIEGQWQEIALNSDESDAIYWKRPSSTEIYEGEDQDTLLAEG